MDTPSALTASHRPKLSHPFDSAWGTLTLGLLVTVVLVAVLRLISG